MFRRVVMQQQGPDHAIGMIRQHQLVVRPLVQSLMSVGQAGRPLQDFDVRFIFSNIPSVGVDTIPPFANFGTFLNAPKKSLRLLNNKRRKDKGKKDKRRRQIVQRNLLHSPWIAPMTYQ